MTTLGMALAEATRQLAPVSDSPRLDAELLLAQVLGRARSTLFAYQDDPLPEAAANPYAELLRRRRAGEPVAYLTGRRGFWTLELAVSPAVLVPRPDTERLVEWALQLPLPEPARVLDLGTGSGAIALALASERPGWQLLASDASGQALAQARANAQGLGLSRVQFRQGSWYAVCTPAERFDLIVSNPPYLAADDPHLPGLSAEPYAALSDGGDGLGALRAIASGAPAWLQPGGWLLLEHGHTQGAAVRALLQAAGLVKVSTVQDLAGHPRVSGGRAP